MEHRFAVHASAPFLSRAEAGEAPAGCSGHHWPKPGARDAFLSEGPFRPGSPLLLVPTSWDTASLEPKHAQPLCWFDNPQNSTSPATPGRIVGGFTSPGFLAFSSALHQVPLPHFPGGTTCLHAAGALVRLHQGLALQRHSAPPLARRQGDFPKHVDFPPKNKPFLYTSLER